MKIKNFKVKGIIFFKMVIDTKVNLIKAFFMEKDYLQVRNRDLVTREILKIVLLKVMGR